LGGKALKKSSQIRLLGISILFLLLASFFALLFLVQSFPPSSEIPENGIIVIFGAGIYNTRPSITLQKRLDRGIELYRSDPSSRSFLVSGTKPEVVIMRQYLLKNNIPSNAILEDPEGKTTALTIRSLANNFASSNLFLVSQQYHLRRIALLCRKYHLTNTYYIATETKPIQKYPMVLLREVFALYKALLWD